MRRFNLWKSIYIRSDHPSYAQGLHLDEKGACDGGMASAANISAICSRTSLIIAGDMHLNEYLKGFSSVNSSLALQKLYVRGL